MKYFQHNNTNIVTSTSFITRNNTLRKQSNKIVNGNAYLLPTSNLYIKLYEILCNQTYANLA